MLLLLKHFKYFFLTLLFYCFNSNNFCPLAQLPAYNLVHYGENEGLIQNSISALVPDNNDFITLSTQGGICKFNGFLFSPVTNAASNNLKGNNPTRISCLVHKGTDTLLAYNDEKDMVSTIYHYKIILTEKYDIRKHGLISARINAALACPEFVKKGKNAIADSFLKEIVGIRNHYNYLFPYHKDTLILIKDSSILFYTDSGLLNNISIPGLKPEDSYYINGHTVMIESKNKLSFISPEGLQGKTTLKFLNNYNTVSYVSDIAGKGIYIIADSDLFYLSIDQYKTITVKFILTDNNLLAKLPHLIWQKDKNTLIMASGVSGLYVYYKKQFNVMTVVKKGFDNVFYSLLLFPDNKTIIANSSLIRDGSHIKGPDKKTNWAKYYNYKDRLGNYWLANIADTSLIKLDKDFKHPAIISKGKYFETNFIYEDNLNRMWVSYNSFYHNKFGLIINGQITELNIPLFLKVPERNLKIRCIIQDKENNYWYGTNDGLFTAAQENPLALKELEIFKGLEIRAIKCDTANNIWICTYGGGFYLVQHNKITNFNNTQKTLAFVHSVIEDGKGNFWLPTNNGIFAVNIDALLQYAAHRNPLPFFYRFTIFDGLKTNEFNLGGFKNDINGNISLSSMNGIVTFNPDSIIPRFSYSPVVIEKILLDTAELTALNQKIAVSTKINTIKIKISTAFWGNNENNQIEYQIIRDKDLAIENNWLPVDQSYYISLTKPNNGEYKIVIRKRIDLTGTGFIYETMYFTVLPNWYQTFTFYIISGVLLLLFISGIYEWRIFILTKKKVTLKKKIAAATQELQFLNNELHEQNRTKSRLISLFSHDISIPLFYITKALKIQMEKLSPNGILRNDIAKISDSAEQLLFHTDNILNWIRVQQKHVFFKTANRYFNLHNLISDQWKLLEPLAEKKQNTLINNLPPFYEINTDKDILGVILYNIISNAVKFTNNGSILINSCVAEKEFILTVKDSGQGMDENTLYRINNYLMVKSTNGSDGEPGKGIGLILVKELAGILKIKIAIESKPMEGTTVKLNIPLQKD